MLARADAGRDAGQRQQHQSLVVVKSLLSTAAHHQRAFEHEADMFSRAHHTSERHVVRLLGVCCSLQPPLIVTEYCELVSTSSEVSSVSSLYTYSADTRITDSGKRTRISKLQGRIQTFSLEEHIAFKGKSRFNSVFYIACTISVSRSICLAPFGSAAGKL